MRRFRIMLALALSLALLGAGAAQAQFLQSVKFFDKTVYLETFVKVDKDWRSSQKELDSFGYNPE